MPCSKSEKGFCYWKIINNKINVPPAKLSEDESRMVVIRMSEFFRKVYFD